jgi:hypothetical protein
VLNKVQIDENKKSRAKHLQIIMDFIKKTEHIPEDKKILELLIN